MAWTTTDSQGTFTFETDNNGNPISNYDGLGRGGKDIFVRVYCHLPGIVIVTPEEVNNPNPMPYIFESNVIENVPEGVVQLEPHIISITKGSGAWNIYDAVLLEHEWLLSTIRWSRPQIIPVQWPDSDETGHYYRPANRSLDYIRIKRDDEWSTSYILHEYAHAVMHSAYKFNPPEGMFKDIDHLVYSTTDPEFAFSEGWAEFIPCAVRNDALYLNDRFGNIETNAWYRVEDQSDNFYGAVVEGSVASIFWDIFDSTDSLDDSHGKDDDFLSYGLENIWTILSQDQPNNINEFWEDWLIRYGFDDELARIYENYGVAINNISSNLVAYNIVGPNRGVTGETISVAFEVSNLSGFARNNVELWLFLSEDSEIHTSDTNIVIALSTLPVDSCISFKKLAA